MSDLQIGLIVLGVLLILLVLGFNWWQDRRVRRKMQSHFPTNEHDPLLGAEQHAGAHGGAGESRAPATKVHKGAQSAEPRREPNFGAGGGSTAGVPSGHAAAAPVAATSGSDQDDAEEVDPAIEAVIELTFGSPVRGAELLPHVQSVRNVGRKPVRIFAETEGGRHRARIHADETYSRLQLAILLANRSGPLTAIEWSQAWARAQDLAERFDASPEGPEQQPVLEHAHKLDDVCAALDTQVGLTLLLGCAQPAAEVLAIARDMGFVHEGPRLAWMSDEGIARFTLSRSDGAPFDAGVGGVEKMNLLLDVPCSPADTRAFGRMVDVGRELASRLRADLVDDQGKPLADGSDVAIDERLQKLFSQLDQAGLRSGSARAQRVFS